VDLTYTISPEPYPGLRSFRKSESDIFFGRDDHIGEMITKLAERHFLCITGPSGCGKSSLARTGLMNHLEAGFLAGRGSNWIFCDLSPGDHPIDMLFRKLADAVATEIKVGGVDGGCEWREQIRQLFYSHITRQRRTSDLNSVLDSIAGIAGRPILILVDQFEELFRYALSDSDAAVDFVEILLRSAAAKRDIYIVITIRTDQLEKCSRYPGLTRMINESQFLTPTLDRYQIQEAIEGPIALWGGGISPAFSTWLLNCLEEELDKLPLMQHALKLLYGAKCSAEGRRDVTMDIDDFIRVFGLAPDLDLSSPQGRVALRTSLSDRLTQRYNGLPDRLKGAARRAFCALTTIDSQHRDIRRPVKLGTLAKTIGESTEDTRTIVRAFGTGDEAYLRCSSELAEEDTIDVTHECVLRLWSPLQSHWLVDEKDSVDNVTLLAGLARDWEDSSKRASIFGRLFAPAVLKGYTRDRYQQWFDSVRPNPTWAARYLNKVDWPAPSKGATARLSPEEIFERISKLLAASRRHHRLVRFGSVAGVVAGVALSTGISVYIYSLRAQQARAISDRIATSGLPAEQTRISNLNSAIQAFEHKLSRYETVWASLQQVYELYRFQAGDQFHAADFTPDSKSILAVDIGGMLYQWALDAEHHLMRKILVGPLTDGGSPAQGRSLKVSPLGDVAAIGFSDGSVVLVNLTTSNTKNLMTDGAKRHSSSAPGAVTSVFNLVFSLDASLLVTSSRAGNVAIWERPPPPPPLAGMLPSADPLLWTLRRNINLDGQPDIWSIDIDRAKQVIAIGLSDGRVCLLWLDNLDVPICNVGGNDRNKTVKSVKFLPDQPRFVSAGNDARVTIWELDPTARIARPWPIPLYHNNDIWDLDVSRDGKLLATASWDGSIRIYQTETWRLLNTVAADRVPQVRDQGTGAKPEGNLQSLRTVRFDPTSSMLVTASLDHTVRVWSPLNDRTSILDLSYRLTPSGGGSVRRIPSVAIESTGDRVAFTDGAAVYVRSYGMQPKALPLNLDRTSSRLVADDYQTQSQGFSQVLMPFESEVVASTADPRLIAWTKLADGEWTTQTVALPGDAIPSGRSIAVDPSGSTLAVEVREGEQTSVILCLLRPSQQGWSCSQSDSSKILRFPLGIDLKPKGCASSDSQVAIALSAIGRSLAASAGRCPIQIFDGKDTRALQRDRTFEGEITSLDFSPDGKALVSTSGGGAQGELRLWDLVNGTSRNINYHSSPTITAARFSPSGRWVVSTSYDNRIIVSSADTGEKLVVLSYRRSLLTLDIKQTPRGVLMATGSEAGDVNIMHFFEGGKDVISYTARVLQDVLQTH
jgi:WD40 repeat protein/energy-coupling factor transporter ATP-binding protein EcfA2